MEEATEKLLTDIGGCGGRGGSSLSTRSSTVGPRASTWLSKWGADQPASVSVKRLSSDSVSATWGGQGQWKSAT